VNFGNIQKSCLILTKKKLSQSPKNKNESKNPKEPATVLASPFVLSPVIPSSPLQKKLVHSDSLKSFQLNHRGSKAENIITLKATTKPTEMTNQSVTLSRNNSEVSIRNLDNSYSSSYSNSTRCAIDYSRSTGREDKYKPLSEYFPGIGTYKPNYEAIKKSITRGKFNITKIFILVPILMNQKLREISCIRLFVSLNTELSLN
jgi:hypothetical protein